MFMPLLCAASASEQGEGLLVGEPERAGPVAVDEVEDEDEFAEPGLRSNCPGEFEGVEEPGGVVGERGHGQIGGPIGGPLERGEQLGVVGVPAGAGTP